MNLTGTLPVHCISFTCRQIQHLMYTSSTCTVNALDLYTKSYQIQHCKCTLQVPYMYNAILVHVHNLYIACTLQQHVNYM